MQNSKSDIKRRAPISIVCTGDFCPHLQIPGAPSARKGDFMFGDTEDIIKNADISVLNLEAPLTRRKKKIIKEGPHLKISPPIAGIIRQAGFSAACLANNHLRDYGFEGIRDTISFLKKEGISIFGVRNNDGPKSGLLVLTKQGWRIGFLGIAENEFGCPDCDELGAWPMNPLENYINIENSASKVDVLVVFVHGGNELCPFPSPRMVSLYRRYIDAGAGAVIGSHAHVPQGYELYKGRPIFYSLGNFLFPWEPRRENELWYRGMMVKLCLAKNKTVSFEFYPIQSCANNGSVRCMNNFERAQFIKYMKKLNMLLKNPRHHEKMWHGWVVKRAQMSWLNRIISIPRHLADISRDSLVALENGIRCEAHYEVGTTYLKLLRTGQLDSAQKYIRDVEHLMRY